MNEPIDVFDLCHRICVAYKHKAFIDGFQNGVQFMKVVV